MEDNNKKTDLQLLKTVREKIIQIEEQQELIPTQKEQKFEEELIPQTKELYEFILIHVLPQNENWKNNRIKFNFNSYRFDESNNYKGEAIRELCLEPRFSEQFCKYISHKPIHSSNGYLLCNVNYLDELFYTLLGTSYDSTQICSGSCHNININLNKLEWIIKQLSHEVSESSNTTQKLKKLFHKLPFRKDSKN